MLLLRAWNIYDKYCYTTQNDFFVSVSRFVCAFVYAYLKNDLTDINVACDINRFMNKKKYFNIKYFLNYCKFNNNIRKL